MSENSKIEWTDHTFNPWIGCTKVSPACKNCYAERDWDQRYRKVAWGPKGNRRVTSDANWSKPLKWNRDCASSKPFVQCVGCGHRGYVDEIGFCPICGDPEGDAARPRVFCASLADVFEDWDGPIENHKGERLYWPMVRHTDDPFEWISELHTAGGDDDLPVTMDDVRRRLFVDVFAKTTNIDKLALTKRPENIIPMIERTVGLEWWKENVAPHCWLGTSVENQEYADKRIPKLLECRDLSPVLFLSCEPMVGEVDLDRSWKLFRGDGYQLNRNQYHAKCPTRGIDWVITGGESGPNARAANPDWFRSLRRQCSAAGVSFHFKQWGEFDEQGVRIGKKKAGRLLDGKKHDGIPFACTAGSGQ